jgi:hypothetical protein
VEATPWKSRMCDCGDDFIRDTKSANARLKPVACFTNAIYISNGIPCSVLVSV